MWNNNFTTASIGRRNFYYRIYIVIRGVPTHGPRHGATYYYEPCLGNGRTTHRCNNDLNSRAEPYYNLARVCNKYYAVMFL